MILPSCRLGLRLKNTVLGDREWSLALTFGSLNCCTALVLAKKGLFRLQMAVHPPTVVLKAFKEKR